MDPPRKYDFSYFDYTIVHVLRYRCWGVYTPDI